jgi:hypothetical protein
MAFQYRPELEGGADDIHGGWQPVHRRGCGEYDLGFEFALEDDRCVKKEMPDYKEYSGLPGSPGALSRCSADGRFVRTAEGLRVNSI